jgi:hypothetical protein
MRVFTVACLLVWKVSLQMGRDGTGEVCANKCRDESCGEDY